MITPQTSRVDYGFGVPKLDKNGERRYGKNSTHTKGHKEDESRCIYEVHDRKQWNISRQCNKKRGHGPDGLFCKYHAKVVGVDNDVRLEREAVYSKRQRERTERATQSKLVASVISHVVRGLGGKKVVSTGSAIQLSPIQLVLLITRIVCDQKHGIELLDKINEITGEIPSPQTPQTQEDSFKAHVALALEVAMNKVVDLQLDVLDLLGERDHYKSALVHYGMHYSDCSIHPQSVDLPDVECVCGFAKAMRGGEKG